MSFIILKKDRKIIEREEEFGFILFDVKTGKVFRLNGMAGDIWHFLSQKGETTLQEILDYVSENFGGLPDAETLESDTQNFLRKLETYSLIDQK